jgi:hypothetical protein
MEDKVKQARLNRNRGKRNEKKIAKLLNGERVGLFGGQDIKTELLSIEAKSRVSFVGRKWMEQCIRNCPEGKVPVVVIHTHNSKHSDDLVIINIEEFKKLLEK